MKQNFLKLEINKPIAEVFQFTITPPNSTRWIDSIIKEETTEFPIRIGTIYKLENREGKITEYLVTDIKENELFELVLKDNSYHVRYIYRSVALGITEFEYYEWVDYGELEEAFTMEVLKRLKEEIECV